MIAYYKMNKNLIWVEIPGWYDGIAYWMDNSGNRYATDKNRTPIWKNEVCRYGKVYEVEFLDERGTEYKIISQRDLHSK